MIKQPSSLQSPQSLSPSSVYESGTPLPLVQLKHWLGFNLLHKLLSTVKNNVRVENYTVYTRMETNDLLSTHRSVTGIQLQLHLYSPNWQP